MRLSDRRWPIRPRGASAIVAGLLVAGVTQAAEPFPQPRLSTPAEAAAFLSRTQPVLREGGCTLPRVLVASDRAAGPRAGMFDRATVLLDDGTLLPAERTWHGAGTIVRYTIDDAATDRVSPIDTDRDGTPDVVQSIAGGLSDARAVLVDGLGLAAPPRIEIVLRELGGSLDGWLRGAGGRIPAFAILDATPCGGVEGARQAALHLYARAVAQEASATFPRGWAEALAHWVRLELEGAADPSLARLLGDRLRRLDVGLFTSQPRLAAGNALWLSYVDRALGRPALVATIYALASGDPPPAALARALADHGVDLATAFRDFHVWTILTGSRADESHFPFAALLPDPVFASENEGLPALSIRADAPVAPWGAAQIRLGPEGRGGLSIHFEGEFSSRWQADLVLVGDGTMRRMALDVSDLARADATIPLDGLAEAFLLVRHIGGVDEAPRRYTYSAHREAGYPFELALVEANEVAEQGGGVLVSWDTSSEHGVVGWDVLRVREDGGIEIAINPVWIPALGDDSAAASYHYLDASAEPGVSYSYRVRAWTTMGLTSASYPVLVRRPVR